MKQYTNQQIINFLTAHWPSSAKQITDHFGFNATIIHRHLKDLIAQWSISKSWKVPKVLYFETWSQHSPIKTNWDQTTQFVFNDIQWLNNHYYSLDSDWWILQWFDGFMIRCSDRKLDAYDQYQQYRTIIEHIDNKRDINGLINTLPVLIKKWQPVYLDQLYVCDTYTVGHFGKSNLWSLAFHAKQSQNKVLAQAVVHRMQPSLVWIIRDQWIDAICFAPISVKRSIQLMDELRDQLSYTIPIVKLQKLFPNNIVVPQKSLKGDISRNKNAINTIFAQSWQKKYDKILLIDDFISSGATLNISAKKLKDAWIAQQVIGLAIVGNMDLSYEVINEI